VDREVAMAKEAGAPAMERVRTAAAAVKGERHRKRVRGDASSVHGSAAPALPSVIGQLAIGRKYATLSPTPAPHCQHGANHGRQSDTGLESPCPLLALCPYEGTSTMVPALDSAPMTLRLTAAQNPTAALEHNGTFVRISIRRNQKAPFLCVRQVDWKDVWSSDTDEGFKSQCHSDDAFGSADAARLPSR
jgi:hypothetical protein